MTIITTYVSLLNIAKSRIFHPVYNFKISKFSTISSDCLPDSQPAIRPGNTSTMAPDFSHKKGNHV